MGGAVGQIGPKIHDFQYFLIYLKFGSSDFDETFRECSWYEKNEGWLVSSHDCPFLPRHAQYLGPNWAQICPKIHFFQYISNLIHQILMKLSGNVIGMKRMKADQFGHMIAHSCPGMPVI